MIIVDIESSGTEPGLHSILAVGALVLEDSSRQFYQECRIWDGAHVMDEALEVNGFSQDQIRDPAKPTEAELVRAFTDWALKVDDQTFAGQNPSFDRDFLKAAAGRAGHTEWPFAARTIDTHTLCYMHMVKRGVTPPHEHQHSGLSLGQILAYCGMPEEPRPHNALTGAKCHAETLSRLLYDKQLLPEFDSFKIPWLFA